MPVPLTEYRPEYRAEYRQILPNNAGNNVQYGRREHNQVAMVASQSLSSEKSHPIDIIYFDKDKIVIVQAKHYEEVSNPNKLETPSYLSQFSELDEMLADLIGLEQNTNMYDEDFIKPTSFAFKRMHALLDGSKFYVTERFPLGTVYPDGSGGLRVDWVSGDKELRLIVPRSETGRSYIWYLEGTRHEAIYAVSPVELGKWLNWLVSE